MGVEGDPLGHLSRFEEVVTYPMRDGMSMVSTYIDFGSGHPLEGFLEVPEAIGEIIHSSYFSRGAADSPVHVSHEPSDEIRELLHAFVSLAFPDEYLELVHTARMSASVESVPEFAEETIYGWDANAELTQRFEKNGYVAPLLSTGIIEDLKVGLDSFLTATSHFWTGNASSSWIPGAGYGLEFGMNDASLARYWGDFPSLPDAFEYSEHGNQAGTGMGFVARSSGLFVSQQVWVSGGAAPWNRCTDSFNTNLAGVLENAGPDGAAIVVFSDYRLDAYIISSVEASWDEYAPVRAVLGPLPEGFGIVGVWSNYDPDRYTPRSFDDVIAANWSDQITAGARYLRDCLEATRRTESD